jgi:phosphopantothenoylcysteine decarboxylase / phosphopantothenate---cysteine ligase
LQTALGILGELKLVKAEELQSLLRRAQNADEDFGKTSFEVRGLSFAARTEYLPEQLLRHDRMRRLLLGVTGSVAASFVPNTLLWLRQHVEFEAIDVILTATASTMVSARAIGSITGGRVLTDTPAERPSSEALHITLTKSADIFLIMPATANVLGKAANGIADNLLTSCVVAAPCNVVFAPCMSAGMWNKLAVQRNVSTLRRDGYHVIEPVRGFSISEGLIEIGAAPDIAAILPHLIKIVENIQ